MFDLPEIYALRSLTVDGRLLFATRVVRMFGYGFLSVVLVLYLARIVENEQQIGLVLAGTLAGDAVLSLWITLIADRVGRRRMLLVGAVLVIVAGLVLTFTNQLLLITIAAIIGTLSPGGNEVGPFLSIEQASLPQTTDDKQRTSVFAWYNLLGSLATAIGAFAAGIIAGGLQNNGVSALDSYKVVIGGYTLIGVVLFIMFTQLSPQIEAPRSENITQSRFGLVKSQGVVFRLTALFMLDAFAGGFVLQSVIAYWFNLRYQVDLTTLGAIFFGANVLAGLSALVAGRIAARFGLINTMVWTHIPSNILLILVPLMPNVWLSVIVLLARFSISQMDVPTRQSYTMAVVDPSERAAAAGITTIARTAASAASPLITGILFSVGLINYPFFLAGALKIVYDLALYRNFRSVRPPEESNS